MFSECSEGAEYKPEVGFEEIIRNHGQSERCPRVEV